MNESLKSVVNFGFNELYKERIEAFTHIQNEKYKNLLVKNCFKLLRAEKIMMTYLILYLRSEKLTKFSNF